jgi:vacuolar-type H+-ATPase subunit E/Vma4
MSLEKILQSLEAEADNQIIEIEQSAQAEIERLRTQAQAEAETVQQKRVAAIQAPLQAERARILNRAHLDGLQIILGTREALIDSALELTARRLAALGTTNGYASLLKQLTQEALDTIGIGGQFCLHVQSCDAALMGRLVQDMDLQCTVAGDLDNGDTSQNCLPGVVVTTPDGRISLVNTLETRLQRAANLYRAQIAKIIFGNEQE